MNIDKVKLKNSIKMILLTLVIMYGLIALGLFLVLNLRELYYYDMEYMKLNQISGFKLDRIRTNYDLLMDYCNPFTNIELKFDGLRVTEEAMGHFKRVKLMIQVIIFTGIPSVIVSTVLVVKKYKDMDTDFFRYAVLTMFIIPMLIIVSTISDWSSTFHNFHKLFFIGDYWTFSWFDDEIIRILPDEYFKQCAVIIIALLFIGCVVIWTAWYRIELGDIISRQRFKDGKLVEQFKLGNETYDRCFKYKLITVNGIEGWNLTAKDNISKFSCKNEYKGYPVISLDCTFENYWHKDISVVDMDTSNIITANNAFKNCRAYSIDISNWNMGKIEDAEQMFKTKYTKEINLSSVDFKTLKNTNSMLEDCEAKIIGVETIDLINANNVKNMLKRFRGKLIAIVKNCSIDDTNEITDIVDLKIVKNEEEAKELLKRAKELKVDRLIAYINNK